MSVHSDSLSGSVFIPVLTILSGILFFISPLWAPTAVIRIGGIVLLCLGAADIFSYIRERGFPGASGILIFGILKAAAGLYLLTRPEALVAVISYVIGLLVLAEGISQAVRFFSIPHPFTANKIATAIVSLVLLACGVSMLAHPLNLVSRIFSWLGLLLIAVGAVNLWNVWKNPYRHDPTEIFNM